MDGHRIKYVPAPTVEAKPVQPVVVYPGYLPYTIVQPRFVAPATVTTYYSDGTTTIIYSESPSYYRPAIVPPMITKTSTPQEADKKKSKDSKEKQEKSKGRADKD